ncbi:MAG: TolC family protein [Elusimicrobiota bacterium]
MSLKTGFLVIAVGVIINTTVFVPVHAEPMPSLTECVSYTITNPELLRLQEQKVRQVSEHIGQAQGDQFPDIRAGYKNYLTGIISSRMADVNEPKITVTQPLYYGGKKKVAVQSAEHELTREKMLLESVKRDIAAGVTETFYNIAEYDIDIRNTDETIELLRKRVKELSDRVRIGKSRESEVLTLEYRISQFLAQREQLVYNRKTSLETLAYYTGKSFDGINYTVNAGSVTAVTFEDCCSNIRGRSDLKMLKEELELQSLRVLTAKAGLLPSVSLTNSWNLWKLVEDGTGWDLTLSIDYPLYRGGMIKSLVKEEEIKKSIVEEQIARKERDIRLELTRIYNNYSSAIAQISPLRNAYEKSVKNYELQLQDYKYSLVNNLEVLTAMTTMLELKRAADRAEVQVGYNASMLRVLTEQFGM